MFGWLPFKLPNNQDAIYESVKYPDVWDKDSIVRNMTTDDQKNFMRVVMQMDHDKHMY